VLRSFTGVATALTREARRLRLGAAGNPCSLRLPGWDQSENLAQHDILGIPRGEKPVEGCLKLPRSAAAVAAMLTYADGLGE